MTTNDLTPNIQITATSGGPAPLRATRPAGLDGALWASLERYLTYDGWREPYYSDVPPVCAFGASAVYFLRKGRAS